MMRATHNPRRRPRRTSSRILASGLGMNASSRPSSLLAYDLMLEALEELPLDEIGKHSRELREQLLRAALSVGLNLTEGQGRSGGHRTQFRRIALGSLYECKSALEMAMALKFVDRARAERVHAKLHRVGGLIYGLLR